ncbi:MAG: hypothetical protein HKP61_01960 [Dactylosporangium sp.]|nr:hypothetical protein [Dactylosporangium sp.]NNJ59726.1 hypothetical protein [Dactylosporangium sp.]
MTAAESPRCLPADAAAQQAADRLALALEEIGFDVGRAFPLLHGMLNTDGTPGVLLGRVSADVAVDLAGALARAAECGVTV